MACAWYNACSERISWSCGTPTDEPISEQGSSTVAELWASCMPARVAMFGSLVALGRSRPEWWLPPGGGAASEGVGS